jgi:serine protease Do
MVAETDIGRAADVVFWRDGKRDHTSVTVGELEKAEENGLLETGEKEDAPGPEGTMVGSVGVALRGLTESDRSAYNIPADVQGVLVTEVSDNSEAAEKGLLVGDVIVEINQQPAADAKTAIGIIDKAVKTGRNSVLLLINREGEVRFSALRLKTDAPKAEKTGKKTESIE